MTFPKSQSIWQVAAQRLGVWGSSPGACELVYGQSMGFPLRAPRRAVHRSHCLGPGTVGNSKPLPELRLPGTQDR